MALGLSEAVLGWLVASIGDGVVGKVRDQQRGPLRKVVEGAVDATVADVAGHLGDADAEHLRAVLRERDLDADQLSLAPGTGHVEGLRGWITALDRPEFGGGGYLTERGLDAARLSRVLIGHIADGIEENARAGGPLSPLAEGLRHDHLREMLARLLEVVTTPSESAAAHEVVPQDVVQLFDQVELSRFTGRRWLTEQVDQFLAHHRCGFVWVEAEAGLGKTTYAAHLVRDRGYLSHFSRLDGGAHTSAAVKNLAAQLIGADQRGALVPGRAQTPEGFANLLRAAAERADEPLVIVIDGLDEVRGAEGAALGLPRVLPPGVFVIGTYRTGSPPDVPDSPHTTLRIKPRSHNNQADIRDYLGAVVKDEKIAAKLVQGDVSPEEFVDELARKCAGIWVYLRYVLNEIRDGQRNVDEVHDLPSDILDYYAASIRRWKTRPAGGQHPDWASTLLPILATLAAAAEPLDIDTIAELAGVPARHRVRDLCDGTFRAFLAVEESGPRRYAIYHAGFREFLHGTLPSPRNGEHPDRRVALADEVGEGSRAAHGWICDFYLDRFGGLTGHLPNLAVEPALAGLHHGYARRHLSHHLVHAGRTEDVHRLLACEYLAAGSNQAVNVWYATHDHAGTPDAYLDDIERARDLAADDANRALGKGLPARALGAEIRYALMAASIHSVTNAVDPMLVHNLLRAGVWGVDRALAQTRVQRDPVHRAQTTALVAPHLQAGQLANALAGALAAARASTDDVRGVTALLALVPHLPPHARSDVVREILTTTRAARVPDRERAGLLAGLAPHLEPDQLHRAVATATEIADASIRVDALAALLPHLPHDHRTGTIEHGIAAIYDIPHAWDRTRALAALAPHLESDHSRAAVAAAEAIEDHQHRLDALTALIPILTDDHRNEVLNRVLVEAGTVADSAKLRHALVLVALSSSVTGDQLRGAIIDARTRTSTLERVRGDGSDAGAGDSAGLPAGLRVDQLRAALAAEEAIDGLPYGTEALAALASHLGADQVRYVYTAAHAIGDRQVRVDALKALFPYLNDDQLVHALKQVLTTSPRGYSDGPFRAMVLVALSSHVTAGQVRQAVSTAQSIITGHAENDRPPPRWRIDEAESRWYGARDGGGEVAAGDSVDLPAGLRVDQLRAALAAEEAIDGLPLGATALAALAPHLGLDQLRATVAAAHAVENPNARVDALKALFPYLDDDQLTHAVEQALAADPVWRSPFRMMVLMALASHVRPDEIRQAVWTARSIATDHAGQDEAEKRWYEVRGRARDVVAADSVDSPPWLRVDQLRAALAAVQAIDDIPERARALGALAPYVPETQRARAIEGALAATHDIASVDDRMRTLAALAPFLEPDHLRTAATLACDDPYPTGSSRHRAEAMAELVPHLPPDLRDRVLDQAFTITSRLHRGRASALRALAPHLRAEQRRVVVADALGGADLDERLDTLAALAPHLTKDDVSDAFAAVQACNSMVEVLSAPEPSLPRDVAKSTRELALGPPFRDEQTHDRTSTLVEQAPPDIRDQLRDSLAAAKAIYWCAGDLAELATRLPDGQRANVRDHYLAAPHTYFGALVLAELAPHLSAEQLDKAIAAAHALTEVNHRAEVLAKLGPHLAAGQVEAAVTTAHALDASGEALADLVPYLSVKQRAAVRDRAEKALDKGKAYFPAVVLPALVPHVSADQRTTILNRALTAISSAYDPYRELGYAGIATALLARAQKLSSETATASEAAVVREFWRDMLRHRSRDNCLQIIGLMAPWIAAQARTPAAEECIAAIDDVSRWWP